VIVTLVLDPEQEAPELAVTVELKLQVVEGVYPVGKVIINFELVVRLCLGFNENAIVVVD
jgi:hypothetical protein